MQKTKKIGFKNLKNKMSNKKIKKLLNKYTSIIEQLRKNKVIRTGKVVADYGEYIACKKLNLKLAGNSVNKGYDAIDTNGKKYEIKTRKATTWNKPSIFPVSLSQLSVTDFLIYIEFNNKWDVIKLLKIPVKKIKINNYNRVCVSKDLIEEFSIL